MSEVMLAQTQVGRVLDRWRPFLDVFPTPAAMSARPQGDVVRAWVGLGYPRRARDLHRTAILVTERHGGAVPDDLEVLLTLPGIGPYTARAVLAFAHERDVGVLDTNIGRIIARWDGRPLTPATARRRADELVPTGEGWPWNQALMDLGALVCTKRVARCDGCPVRAGCAWQGAGDDPAIGSAAVSGRQAAFEGSDRQLRGRLLAAAAERPVGPGGLAGACGIEDRDRARAVADSLVADGLLRRTEHGGLVLA